METIKRIFLVVFRIVILLGCLLIFSDNPEGNSPIEYNLLGFVFVIINFLHYNRDIVNKK